ncbi:hypothetical protein [Methylobacterium sp. Leaf106]|uniref:hypothetical protein n=1 Tax=Methylobacterium sp. Leaf106 TaxID=1736255 RepID=UPI0007011855|nr:hypothetical protein [Methylobacterium sp. Leaf106]KQP52972.1 hypothetical protein ASF34_00955 [Methylobacterium sp. Leaf106]
MSAGVQLILPPLRRTAADAERFARVVHAGQFDKAGQPYIRHLERVAARTERYFAAHFEHRLRRWDEAIQLAWLHDILEPDPRPFGPVTRERLEQEGFDEDVVVKTVFLGQPPSGGSYLEKAQTFAIWYSTDLHTLLVKIADVEDNSDPARLAHLPAETRARLEKKYGAALPVLKAAAERLGWKEITR